MDSFTRGGLTFEVTDTGPHDGEVVVLLHGWPQSRDAWTAITPGLTGAGLRVLAPDQRGYSPRARPTERAAYRMHELVADVVALIDASGAERVHLAGHDWGGAVAWMVAERQPERLASLTVLSTPHHAAMAWAMRHGGQARKSWYMAAFQVPVLPELLLRRRVEGFLRRSGLPEPTAQAYAARLREPGAASAGLAWYRAMVDGREILRAARSVLPGTLGRQPAGDSRPARAPRIQVPTTFVWGTHDPALGRAAAERTRRYVEADYRFVELDAGHWLPETRAAEVTEAILARVMG